MNYQLAIAAMAVSLGLLFTAHEAHAQEQSASDLQQPITADDQTTLVTADAGPARDVLIDQPIVFDIASSHLPNNNTIEEILWDFGDGTRTTGAKVSHTYTEPGSYLITLTITTDAATLTDTAEMRAFRHLIVLVADDNAPTDQLELHRQQAAKEGILLLLLRARGGGPEALVEEELTTQLIDARTSISHAHLIIMWTSGDVGANVLTKFSQHIKQAEGISQEELKISSKGIILLSTTPLALLQPAAQSVFDQLHPSYVILTRPQVLDILLTTNSAEEVKDFVLTSPLEYRLLGTFSARTVSDIGPTNLMSFGINFLVNRGVPINNIVLILMLPIVATILAFARQVIGIRSFGLITPAMTTVSFLVMGLRWGLIVFAAVLLAGTLTRFVLRRLRLLYLPRMALVLTSVSLTLLLVLGLGVAGDRSSILSFSIFPALILTILAEEFIAVQFKSGVRAAFTVTAWTLALATFSYIVVSSEIFRTLILSYPEITLLAIPINIILGRWSGLRLTEYFRFRELLRHGKPSS